ncbi:dnaJ homolog subfamily C member 24 isoform X2 [Stigmatopora nigra]
MSLKKDLYAILGASPSDSVQELRHKYQKLVLQYHPDRLGDVCDFEAETSMKMFLEIDAAWKILCEVESRKIYDQQTRDREFKQDWPVDSVVSLKDMTWDQDLTSTELPISPDIPEVTRNANSGTPDNLPKLRLWLLHLNSTFDLSAL